MEKLLEENDLPKSAQIGKIIEGKIIGKARSAVFLDLGAMGTGIIYGREFQEAKEKIKSLKLNSPLSAKVIELENEEGYIELSLSQASDELTWKKLREEKRKGQIFKVKILDANKGGLITELFGLQAFIPTSQLSSENFPRVEKGDFSKIVEELQKLVGQEIEVKIFDLDPRQGKLILSEKTKENKKIKEALEKFKVGDVVNVEITGLTNFGAFVKFKEEKLTDTLIEGLIHISELDWQLVEDPADLVQVGQVIKAKIISITDNKISLSLKALEEDPWQDIKYKKGDLVKGEVTKINPYGAFIQIKPKIQGLCHISEFGTKTKMEESLKIGQSFDFEITSIDLQEHRMNLRLKK